VVTAQTSLLDSTDRLVAQTTQIQAVRARSSTPKELRAAAIAAALNAVG